MSWFRNMSPRIPADTDLWPETEGAGYSPNESNGVLSRLPVSSWQVEPSEGPEWDWPVL
jgi:hypothetical protein